VIFCAKRPPVQDSATAKTLFCARKSRPTTLSNVSAPVPKSAGPKLIFKPFSTISKRFWRSADVFPDTDLSAPSSSGSTHFDALVILPCSAGTLNKIAGGIADTLLTRSAMVALKERRKLVICLRETPISTQTLRNAAQLSADGAIIMPIMPPYYMNPLTTGAVLEGFSKRLLQVLGQPQGDLWKGEQMESEA
jgi:polyprenyl P-hydroxybenzoate/phenylacrylic acid decarboxylase-like protein